jgi:hypothetical protein
VVSINAKMGTYHYQKERRSKCFYDVETMARKYGDEWIVPGRKQTNVCVVNPDFIRFHGYRQQRGRQ